MKTKLQILKEELTAVEAQIRTLAAEKNSVKSHNESLDIKKRKEILKIESTMESKIKHVSKNTIESLRSGLAIKNGISVFIVGAIVLISISFLSGSDGMFLFSLIVIIFQALLVISIRDNERKVKEYDRLSDELKQLKSLPIEGLKTFNNNVFATLNKKVNNLKRKINSESIREKDAIRNARILEIKSGSNFLASDIEIHKIDRIANEGSEDYKASYTKAVADRYRKEKRESERRNEEILQEAVIRSGKQHLYRVETLRRSIQQAKRWGDYTLVPKYEARLLQAEEDYREYRRNITEINLIK